MELLNKLMNNAGTQTALGLYPEKMETFGQLPKGCSVIGCTDTVQFCRIEGYLDTVFAVSANDDYAAVPLAYCLQDFIRLILSCGCAQAAAEGVVNYEGRKKMEKLALRLKLPLMKDPVGYIHTVGQLIDHSKILLKSQMHS